MSLTSHRLVRVEPRTHLCIHADRLSPGSEWVAAPDEWTVLKASSGSFYWIARSDTSELNTGDVLVIAPHAPGLLRASLIGQAVLHSFSFRPEHLGGLMSPTERFSFDAAANRAIRLIRSDDPIATEFAEITSQETGRRGFLLRCRLLQLIGLIFGATSPLRGAVLGGALTSELRFEQVIEQISDADLMTIPSEKLADMCGCSTRHFRRLFRKRFNTSIRAKQTQLRLEKARQLLAETNQKVVTVALESGYRHLGLFNSTFKKKFGMTPTQWRRLSSIKRARPRPIPA